MIRLPMMHISKNCVECDKTVEFDVRAEDYDCWKEGILLIQEALWYISPDNREMLLSGICGDCWNKLFSEESE